MSTNIYSRKGGRVKNVLTLYSESPNKWNLTYSPLKKSKCQSAVLNHLEQKIVSIHIFSNSNTKFVSNEGCSLFKKQHEKKRKLMQQNRPPGPQ